MYKTTAPGAVDTHTAEAIATGNNTYNLSECFGGVGNHTASFLTNLFLKSFEETIN